MRLKVNKDLVIEMFIILLVTNYMFVTIIMDDVFYLKYLRDISLLTITGYYVCSKPKLKNIRNLEFILLLLLIILLAISSVRTGSVSLNIITLRKYLFPLITFVVLSNYNVIKNYQQVLKFLLYFFSVFSLWGIFQAYILKDTFLKMLGYPTVYLYAYKREMLGNSFYFGNLGIQRLVSTLSNSNAAAVILGMTLILLICCYPYIRKIRNVNICLLTIFAGYMATVSRANFLAMAIILLISFYKYIPYKKTILVGIQVGIVIVVVLGVIQGEAGIVFKLAKWVQNTVRGMESSSAGRPGIWMTAFRAVMSNPLGMGFGHVGTLASNARSTLSYYACENSYLAVALDIGISGAICFLGFWLIIKERIKKMKKSIKRECIEGRILLGSNFIITYFLIAIMFSNHIYDLEVMTLFCIYIGLACQICSRRELRV